jgi:hypothetical protein
MADSKKTKYESETGLGLKLKPAPHPAAGPTRRDEEAAPVKPVDLKKPENKEMILKIIDFIESL